MTKKITDMTPLLMNALPEERSYIRVREVIIEPVVQRIPVTEVISEPEFQSRLHIAVRDKTKSGGYRLGAKDEQTD